MEITILALTDEFIPRASLQWATQKKLGTTSCNGRKALAMVQGLLSWWVFLGSAPRVADSGPLHDVRSIAQDPCHYKGSKRMANEMGSFKAPNLHVATWQTVCEKAPSSVFVPSSKARSP